LWLLFHIPANVPVLPPEEQKGISFAYYHILNFRDKDSVITGFMRGLQAALQVSQRSLQDWCAMPSPIKPGSSLFRTLVLLRRPGVVLGNVSLRFGKYIDPKPFFGVQVGVCPRPVIHAYQHQYRIQRH
jgi:hypothetical protein